MVVRLPLRRQVRDGSSWAFISANRDALTLLGDAGEFLGSGDILPRERARAVYDRRHEPTGKHVQRPPEDFLPPAG